jgi:hypothetical protein
MFRSNPRQTAERKKPKRQRPRRFYATEALNEESYRFFSFLRDYLSMRSLPPT